MQVVAMRFSSTRTEKVRASDEKSAGDRELAIVTKILHVHERV